jgi:hypothetical protein
MLGILRMSKLNVNLSHTDHVSCEKNTNEIEGGMHLKFLSEW